MKSFVLALMAVLCIVCTASAYGNKNHKAWNQARVTASANTRVDATPNINRAGKLRSETIDTGGYWVFCPGGQCPPQQPQQPPKFDFPEDEDTEEVPEIVPSADSNVALILSAIAAIAGVISGYLATRESEEAKESAAEPPPQSPAA